MSAPKAAWRRCRVFLSLGLPFWAAWAGLSVRFAHLIGSPFGLAIRPHSERPESSWCGATQTVRTRARWRRSSPISLHPNGDGVGLVEVSPNHYICRGRVLPYCVEREVIMLEYLMIFPGFRWVTTAEPWSVPIEVWAVKVRGVENKISYTPQP